MSLSAPPAVSDESPPAVPQIVQLVTERHRLPDFLSQGTFSSSSRFFSESICSSARALAIAAAR